MRAVACAYLHLLIPALGKLHNTVHTLAYANIHLLFLSLEMKLRVNVTAFGFYSCFFVVLLVRFFNFLSFLKVFILLM